MKRAATVSVLAPLPGCAHADEAGAPALPTPEEYAAHVRAGTLDPKRFDSATAGYWRQPDYHDDGEYVDERRVAAE